MSAISSRLQHERKRANEAFQCVTDANNESYAEEYKSLVMKTPMRIKSSGLGATLAFMFSKKGKNEHDLLYSQLSIWLRKLHLLRGQSEQNEFVYEVIMLENAQYRVLTVEALAFVAWLRRFADGMINKKEHGVHDGEIVL
jgi:CRISPR-associated protein Cmr5